MDTVARLDPKDGSPGSAQPALRDDHQDYPKPIAVRPYFDKLQVWLRCPADAAIIDRLGSDCGRGGVYAQQDPAAFDASYRQRIELRQPSAVALAWVASQPGALINRAELALDFVFACDADRQDAFAYLNYHLLRRWHSKAQKIRLVGGLDDDDPKPKRVPRSDGKIVGSHTRYDAGGGHVSNSLVLYEEAFSRVTGELSTLHLEWRANKLRAVKSAGIAGVGDVLGFDHRAFWRKRLLLGRVDPDRLGRLVRNAMLGTKRRITDRHDGRTGAVLLASVGTVQEVLDEYGHLGRLCRAIDLMPIEPWLPS